MLKNPIGFLTPFTQRSIGPDIGSGPVLIDAVVEENLRFDASVTDHPIEVASRDGVANASISDHVYLEPKQYTMRGVVSDFPITWRQAKNVYAESGDETRSISAFQLLKRHFESRISFSVQMDLMLLKNMVFVSLQVPRNPRNTNAIEFIAEMREVMIVVPQVLKREKAAEDVAGDDQAETQAVEGIDSGEVATPEIEQSFGAQLFGG